MIALAAIILLGIANAQTTSLPVEARQVVTGQVTDAQAGTPLSGVSVFVSGTTIGTSSDRDGNFSLTVPIQGSFEIAVRLMGFESVSHPIELPQPFHEINIALQEQVTVLSELVVRPCIPHRRRDENLFWRTILGENRSNRGMQVLNPEVVTFCLTADGILRAFADEPIEIINHNMGYHILYVLQSFERNAQTQQITRSEMVFFTELTPENDRQRNSWERARQETYAVSLTRFIRSLYREQLHQNGFFFARIVEVDSRQHNVMPQTVLRSVPTLGQQQEEIRSELALLLPSQANILQRDADAVRVNITEPIFLGCFSQPVTSQMLADPNSSLLFSRSARFPLIRLLPLDIIIYSDGSYSGVLNIAEYRGSILGLNAQLPIEFGMQEDFFLPSERDLSQGTPTVMMIDFDTGRDIPRHEADAIVAAVASILTVHLQQGFEVVNASEVDRIIQEQGFDRETLTVQEMEIVDAMMNLSIVITGSINRRHGGYSILASALDVEGGTVLTSVGETGGRGEALHRVSARVAQNLLAEIQRSEVPVPQEIDVEELLRWDAIRRGVLINGVVWAASNVDARPGSFTDSPELAGRFNPWGVRTNWDAIGTPRICPVAGEIWEDFELYIDRRVLAFVDIYGAENVTIWEDAGPRDRFIREMPADFADAGAANQGDWINDNPCPPGWRVPYRDEFESLIASGSFWTTVNGVPGRVFGTAPNQIFLPAAGGGGIDHTQDYNRFHVAHVGQIGYYWTRERQIDRSAWKFRFSQAGYSIDAGGDRHNMRFGYNIRCVLQTDEILIEF